MRKLTLDDIKVLAALRTDSRSSLNKLAKEMGLPHSTVHDWLKSYEKGIIHKHAALIDFSKLGFDCRATIAIKLSKHQTDELRSFVLSKEEVNNAYEINSGYDVLIECIFRSKKELKLFIEELEEKFAIQERHVFEMYNDLKRETFMTHHTHVNYNDLI